MSEVVIDSGEGCFTVRERGGRVSELRPRTDLDNVLFPGPSNGLQGLDGGDRMWLAPETEVFYDDLSDPSSWRCPPELDPGSWSMEKQEGAVVLTQTALGAKMTRRIHPLDRFSPAGGLPWSGYRVTNSVVTAERRSAWHLLALPAPNDIYVRWADDPVIYYPPAPPVRAGWIDVDDSPPRWKAGFPPPGDSRCLIASSSRTDPGALVVLTASLAPGGTYVDVPPGGGDGACVQAYNSGGGGFCEIELHAPLETKVVEALVVAVWGSKRQRRAVLEELSDGGV